MRNLSLYLLILHSKVIPYTPQKNKGYQKPGGALNHLEGVGGGDMSLPPATPLCRPSPASSTWTQSTSPCQLCAQQRTKRRDSTKKTLNPVYQVQAFRLTSGPGGGAILPPKICLILTQLGLTKNF